jgi:hypothetical protein
LSAFCSPPYTELSAALADKFQIFPDSAVRGTVPRRQKGEVSKMSRKLILLSSFLALFVIAGMTMSCGGSSNSGATQPCTGGPFNVVGDWQGTFTGGGTTTDAIGAIDSAGLAVFFDAVGDTAVLPAITGTCSFSGNLSIYQAPDLGSALISGTAQGNVTSATAISGTQSNSTFTGNFSLASYVPLTGSVVALSGSRTAPVEGEAVILQLTFSPSGPNSSMSFTGTDGFNCTVSGTFTEQGTSNVFDVSMTDSGTGCPGSGTMTGIGFESDTDYFTFNGGAAGTYLYADLLATNGPFAIEIFQQVP